MNLLDTLLNNSNGQLTNELSNKFGLGQDQTNSAIKSLIPMLSRGVQKNISNGGIDSLIGALSSGSHAEYLDNPAKLSQDDAINDGNSILGHILGSKDVSRNVAAHASKETGIDPSILKQMLPILAAAAMGALSKNSKDGGLLGSLIGKESSSSKPEPSLLESFLDSDKDGSIADDVLKMATKLF